MTTNYIAKKSDETIHKLREALSDSLSDVNSMLTIDWDTIPEEKLIELLPFMDKLESLTNTLAMYKVMLLMVKMTVEKENDS